MGKRFALVLLLMLVLIPLGFRYQAARRETEDARAVAPQNGRFVHAHDVDVFIQEAGRPSDPPIILMHGTGAWSETWRAVLNVLAGARFYAIAIDTPPFGYSSRPVDRDYSRAAQASRIIGVMDALNIRRAILVGHSFGSRATITAALKAPERVSSLILVDAAVGITEDVETTPDGPGVFVKLLGIESFRNAVVAMTLTNPALSRKFIGLFVHDPKSVTDEIVATYQRPMKLFGTTDNVGAWLYDFLATDDSTLQSDIVAFGKTNVRTAIIWGDQDKITPMWQAHALQKLIPNSTLSTLPGVGHIPHLEAPDQFHITLLQILRQLN